MTIYLYKNLEKRVAQSDEVQNFLDDVAFVMKSIATVHLVAHRLEGHARIEIERGRIDRQIVLSDERGQEAALSIEFGRAGWIDPETGEVWGEMKGLFILANAAGLPKRRRAFGPRKVRRRPRRDPKTNRFIGGA